MSTGPTINKGKSNQNYQTPPDFMAAVHARYGKPTLDLAASADNAQAPSFYNEHCNSLTKNWHETEGVLWLNPPFAKIGDWAQKCWIESVKGASILMLVPNSTGSNWFRDFVHNKAYVNLLNGRLTFVGCKDPYPKDMILIEYGFNRRPGYGVWDWRHSQYNL